MAERAGFRKVPSSTSSIRSDYNPKYTPFGEQQVQFQMTRCGYRSQFVAAGAIILLHKPWCGRRNNYFSLLLQRNIFTSSQMLFFLTPEKGVVHILCQRAKRGHPYPWENFWLEKSTKKGILRNFICHLERRQCEIKDIKVYQVRTKIIALGCF